MTGTIPTEVGRLTYLSELLVNSNFSIFGYLPFTLLAFCCCRSLYQNFLSGTIPTEIGMLQSLGIL